MATSLLVGIATKKQESPAQEDRTAPTLENTVARRTRHQSTQTKQAVHATKNRWDDVRVEAFADSEGGNRTVVKGCRRESERSQLAA